MSESDPHAPTNAAPSPDAETEPIVEPAPFAPPPPPVAAPVEDPNPERKVAAAFAGGLIGALFLKSLANRRHR